MLCLVKNGPGTCLHSSSSLSSQIIPRFRMRIPRSRDWMCNGHPRPRPIGCTGEESVFEWRLQGQEDTSESATSSSSSNMDWRLASVQRDGSNDEDEIPERPHPRWAPELIIMGQLAALRRGDVVRAAAFNMNNSLSGATAYRTLLRQASSHALLTHTAATIQASALPSQRAFVAEVHLTMQHSRLLEGGRRRFLFRLGLDPSGCWRVESQTPF